MPGDKPHDPFAPPEEAQDALELDTDLPSFSPGFDGGDNAPLPSPSSTSSTDAPMPGEQPGRRARRMTMADQIRPTLSKRMAVIAFATVSLLTAAEITATVIQHGNAATDDQWNAAARKLRQSFETKTDAILVAPAWAEPVANARLGDLLTLDAASISDVDRYARVWQLSIRGAQHPWTKKLKMAKEWTFGKVSLRRYEQTPAKVLHDFTEHIGQAQVSVVGANHVLECAKAGNRFNCNAKARWNWVGKHLAEVNHRPYRCVYAHAVEGRQLLVTFDRVKLGTKLVAYTGIDDFENRKRSKAPVTLKVFVDGKAKLTAIHPNEGPWTRHEATTSSGYHRVRFEISTPKAYARQFCFHAEARQ